MKKFTSLIIFLATGLVSYAQTTEQEPNNSFATANYFTIDNVTTGGISTGSDNDYFVSHMPYDGTLKVYVAATNTGSIANWLRLTVFASAKGQLTARYISGISSINPGTTVYDTITLWGRAADTLFFRFDAGGSAFSYTFRYEIKDVSTNDIEPNNSFGTAGLINQSETKSGHIKYVINGITDDYDFYRSKTTEDGTLKIFVKATNTSGSVNSLRLTVSGSDKRTLVARYITGSSNIAAGATVNDTITLKAHGVDSVYFRLDASGAFSYEFSYKNQADASYDPEPNNSFGSGIAVNQDETQAGHIKYIFNGAVDEYDYFRTKTSADGTLRIYVSATNTGYSANWLYLSVFGGDKTVTLGAKYISGKNSIVEPGVTVYDTLTIPGIGADSIFLKFWAGETFSYNFKYQIVDIIGSGDKEPNNTFETAIKTNISQTKAGHLQYKANGSNDLIDFYMLPVPNKGNLPVIVELTNNSSTAGWVQLFAYNKKRKQILQQYIKNSQALQAGQIIRDTITLKCYSYDTIYLEWYAGQITSYRFSVALNNYQPYASMTHERLGNTVGFRPQLANADKFIWDFGDGTTSTQKYPMKTFPNGYFVTRLIATNSVCNFKDTAQTVTEVKGVEYYTPDSSGVGGDCIFKVFGGGLDASTEITLKMGSTELTPIHFDTFKNNIQLNAIFDFHSAEEGTYDVVIKIKGLAPLVYPGGFRLSAFRYPYTWSEIVAPSKMRRNISASMTLVVGNKGNVMASGVIVAVLWPRTIDLKFDTKWFKPPSVGNYMITAADTTFTFRWKDIQPFYSDTFNTVTSIDTFNLKPYEGYMRLLLIPKIEAGGTVEIPLIAKTNTIGDKDFITYTYKPNLFGSCPNGSWMDAMENTAVELCDGLDKVVSSTPVLNQSPVKWLTKAAKGTTKHMANLGQVMGATYNYATGVTTDIYSSLPADFNSNVDAGNAQVAGAVLNAALDILIKKGAQDFMKGQTDQLNKFIANNPNASESSIRFAIDNLNNINDVRNIITTMYKNGKDVKQLLAKLDRLRQLVKDCPELKAQLDELMNNLDRDMTLRDPRHTISKTVYSFDPNEIIGPAGVGANQYVLRHDKQQFTITFENKETAQAAAQIVTVSDTLDVTRFNPKSFEFGNFTIANKTYTVPKGRREFVLEDSLSPNMKVRVNGKLETISGVITWQFTAIDPATGDIPVFEGFLPPNTIMPEGEGSVSFTVLPNQNLADGVAIKNHATIIFDQNEPILTNTWQNTVDDLPPLSTVSATRIEGSPEIHLTLSGRDASSGLDYYSVYIQETGGEWLSIGNAYGDHQTIIADSSKQYNFYVIATDRVGNMENKTPGAETTVGINELIKGKKGQLSLGPNPAHNLVYIGGLKQSNSFNITDLLGKKMFSGIVSENNNSIDIHQLNSGMYILSIYSNGSVESFKLLKTQ